MTQIFQNFQESGSGNVSFQMRKSECRIACKTGNLRDRQNDIRRTSWPLFSFRLPGERIAPMERGINVVWISKTLVASDRVWYDFFEGQILYVSTAYLCKHNYSEGKLGFFNSNFGHSCIRLRPQKLITVWMDFLSAILGCLYPTSGIILCSL
jgi:hypothetical protein